MPGTIIGAGKTMENNIDQVPVFGEFTFYSDDLLDEGCMNE